jgi:hypothetical protein
MFQMPGTWFGRRSCIHTCPIARDRVMYSYFFIVHSYHTKNNSFFLTLQQFREDGSPCLLDCKDKGHSCVAD